MFTQNKGSKTQFPFKNVLELEKKSSDLSGLNKERLTRSEESKKSLPLRKEFTLFSYNQYHEQEIVRKKIKELIELIRQEIELIRKTEKTLLSEVKDIENLTVQELPAKPGLYHVRFFEIVLSLLRNVRKKVSESKTWLEALMTKKKKRGSLFLVRTKKMGTQYSLSQELQAARSVQ